MAQNVFTYVYEDSFIDQRILQLASEIHGQCAQQTGQIKEKMPFQFIIYNDSIVCSCDKSYGCEYFYY